MTPPARILFVDDEEPLRAIVHQHFSSEGYNITTAMNGEEAIESLKTTAFDLLILDIRMPGLDGLAVLREMKKRNIKPRIIVLTGVNEIDIAVAAAKLGANDYITKPFEMEELAESARRVLQV
jgi:DNA-binding response OmpR family regulator